MKPNFYTLSFKITILLYSFFYFLNIIIVKAEGTKEFRPDSSYYGNMQINDMGRPFALESNSDLMHRLYFHIKDYTTEKVYIGFKHVLSGSETATYRIMDPNGNVAKTRKTIPASGTGYIKYYSQAVAGPIISGTPVKGYTPIVFTPTMNGDYYIEFTTSYEGTTTAYHFDLFDLTVATSTTNRIKGRMWSYCWDLNTRSYSNRYWGKFYSYSEDMYVSEFSMNGIQPFGFTISCNNSGTSVTGDANENRKSVAGNSTRPQYKIFLNDPDINCYPSGDIPIMMENLALVDTPFVGEPALFTLKMSESGTIEMVIELNGTPGYQPNSRDVVIVKAVTGGTIDTVSWDGKDGEGITVESDEVVVSSAAFYSGVTNFPLYDPETNDKGYIVNRIRPVSGSCKIYWDDSNFTDGTTNIEGEYGPAHTWPYLFGDVRTMNTWWDGFRIDTLAKFSWRFKNDPMPVEFIDINAVKDDEHIDLNWATASETNNDYFTIERASDGINFLPLSIIKGSGNSNSLINYSYADNNPIEGVNYYRIKQTDFDGKYEYSIIMYIEYSIDAPFITVLPSYIKKSDNINIVFNNEENNIYTVTIYSTTNQKIYEYTISESTSIPAFSYNEGIYFITIISGDKNTFEKIVIY